MVREVGAIDSGGNLIAIGKFPETYKPIAGDGSIKDLILKMVLEVSNTSSVTLKIDPTVILASKKDVLDLEKKIKKLENTVETLELVDTKVKLTDPDELFEFGNEANINQAILANRKSVLSKTEIIVTDNKNIPRKDNTFYFIVTDEQSSGDSSVNSEVKVSPNMGIKII